MERLHSVRVTIDWSKLSLEPKMVIIFIRQTQNWRQIRKPTVFRRSWRGINDWNKFLTMPYWEYRHQIKKIALRNWLEMGVRIQFCNLNALRLKDEDYIVPSDDDDWFRSDLPDKLRDLKHDFVHWRSITHITFSRHHVREWWKPHLSSNNYAIRGSLFNRLSKKDRNTLAYGHAKSLPLAKKKTTPYKINEVLSCYNWHPGSASVLSRYYDPSKNFNYMFPKEFFPKNFKEFKYPFWAAPYAREFCNVLREIKTKDFMML